MLDVRDRPRFSTERAGQLAQDIYGVRVGAEPLPSERDQNFLLTRGGRPSWILKIANKSEERPVLELQNEALWTLEQREPALTVPQVLPTLDGQLISIRLYTTVALAAKHASQDPDRPHLSINVAGAWRLLPALDGLDRSGIVERYRRAIGLKPPSSAPAAGRQALRRR